jgi:hypothetical protein
MLPSTNQPSHSESLYFPLATAGEIRLLSLQPRACSETITCTTKHVKLSKKPQYEALSYEWGAKETKQISFNGNLYGVRLNLYNALVNLRHETEERVLWIDALCINQKDMKERNHQVSQMARIYRGATCVVAWLGLDKKCVKAVEVLQSAKIPGEEYLWRGPLDFPPLSREDMFSMLQALSQRKYWSRLWIIQEIYLASQLRIQCGTYSIPWDRLRSIYLSFYNGRYPVQNYPLKIMKKRRLRAIAKIILSHMGQHFILWPEDNRPFTPTLFAICFSKCRADCENVLDKVFGLSALSLSCCQQAVPIDYGLTIDELLEKVISHELDAHSSGLVKYRDPRELEYSIKRYSQQSYLARFRSQPSVRATKEEVRLWGSALMHSQQIRDDKTVFSPFVERSSFFFCDVVFSII